MGLRGPQSLPTAIKKARGTYREDRSSPNEPVASGTPICPKWITDEQLRKDFKRLVKQLSDMNVVGVIDTNILTRYCTTWTRWKRVIQTLIDNAGAEIMVFKDEDGKPKMMQVSALHSCERSLSEALGRMENSMGMNPSARSRINIVQNEKSEANGILNFISNGQ